VTNEIANAISKSIVAVLEGMTGEIRIEPQLKYRWIRDLYSWSLMESCIEEAQSRDIPLVKRWYNCVPLIEFGYSCNRRLIIGPVSDTESGTSIVIGSNKLMGRALLQQLEIPLPAGMAVNSLAEAGEAADSIGYKVVLKSPTGSNSVGVVTGITNHNHLAESYSYLRRRFPYGPLLLEKMLEGKYFRVLLVDGKFLRASSGRPSQISGTGRETIRELMTGSLEMFDGVDDSLSYRLEGLLLSQGVTVESIPDAGTSVNITPVTANWSDISDEVDALNIQWFEAIGRSLGPSILGIDIIAQSLNEPLLHGRDGIVEINCGSGFAFHKEAAEIWQTILNRLLAGQGGRRVPIICVVECSGTRSSRSISPLYGMHHVNTTSGRAVWRA